MNILQIHQFGIIAIMFGIWGFLICIVFKLCEYKARLKEYKQMENRRLMAALLEE